MLSTVNLLTSPLRFKKFLFTSKLSHFIQKMFLFVYSFICLCPLLYCMNWSLAIICKLLEWLWELLNRTISQLLNIRVMARALHEYRPFVIKEQRQFVVLANTLSFTNLFPECTKWTWPLFDVMKWASS